MRFLEPGTKFRSVFLLDSRAWFAGCRAAFDPARDLVLTYDFALKREIEGLGGKAHYIDHLVESRIVHENNYLAYEFLRKWHCDADGRDIFSYKGVQFGSALRIYIWSEFLIYVSTRLCLEMLRELRFDSVFAGTQLRLVETVLGEMGIDYSPVRADESSTLPRYYFPIHEWMTERVIRRGLKPWLSTVLTGTVGTVFSWFDRIPGLGKAKPAIFVQNYHPTTTLIQRLKRDARVRVVGLAVSKSFLRTLGQSRYIPFLAWDRKFRPVAQQLLGRFSTDRCARLVLTNGVDVTEGAYATIEKYVAGYVAETIRMLDCAIRYLDKNPVRLEVMVSNVGGINGVVDCVCKSRNVPSYMIINGWLGGDFLDEGKYATVINGYATSIKANYFRGMDNVVCLGDPRMDCYPPLAQPRAFDKDSFTVTIGASGYNNLDLNSYVAVEFEFMFDVLQALSLVKKQCANMRIIVKVRPNGYLTQYRQFTQEYFPGLVDEILDNTPMKEVLDRSDFYISIYSQTIFEASCLGIPSVYYKKDTEVMDPPFDGLSELVTAGCVEDLVRAIGDFRGGGRLFDAFMQRQVMEKYIGPLDGGNLERNLSYIYDLLNQRAARPTSCKAT